MKETHEVAINNERVEGKERETKYKVEAEERGLLYKAEVQATKSMYECCKEIVPKKEMELELFCWTCEL